MSSINKNELEIINVQKYILTNRNRESVEMAWPSRPHAIKAYLHYSDIIMSVMASQITSLTIVFSTVYSVADQRKHQSSASLAFVGQ